MQVQFIGWDSCTEIGLNHMMQEDLPYRTALTKGKVPVRQSHCSLCGKPVSASHLSCHALGPQTPCHYLENYVIIKYKYVIILIIKSYQNKEAIIF